jgi:hypothetical protein
MWDSSDEARQHIGLSGGGGGFIFDPAHVWSQSKELLIRKTKLNEGPTVPKGDIYWEGQDRVDGAERS